MTDCWICTQKAEWKAEKLNTARAEAKTMANETGNTIAIYKVGCDFKLMNAFDSNGFNVVEFISKYQ